MLQSSEYNIHDYLSWYFKVSDFKKVEVRKKFNKTLKGLLLLVCAWVIIILSFILIDNLLLALLLFPYILAYGIIIPLLLIKLIQLPIEYYLLSKTKTKIKNHKAFKIAIAGSFGKTTMREILKTVLSEGKIVSAPKDSYNTPLGISKFVEGLSGDEEIIIFELGEYYPGDIRQLCDIINPNMGIITGINEAHLKRFKTIDNTVKTIYELGEYLDFLYVNGDSPLALDSARKTDIIYSSSGMGTNLVLDAKTDLNGLSFKFRNSDFKSKLLGVHQIGPLVCAIEIALSLGLSMEQIQKGIAKTKPFSHRLEPKTDSSGVIIIDDSYNGNPDGVRVAIDFLKNISGRRFYITPGLVEMGAKTKEVHLEIGKMLALAGIEHVVLIRNSVTSYIEEGLKDNDFKGELIWFDSALEAYNSIPSITISGDVVLLQNDWPDQYL
jgi:UDP-N-acetylmuramoyl-tripeptide--D-alanyl-D-alanine ligase